MWDGPEKGPGNTGTRGPTEDFQRRFHAYIKAKGWGDFYWALQDNTFGTGSLYNDWQGHSADKLALLSTSPSTSILELQAGWSSYPPAPPPSQPRPPPRPPWKPIAATALAPFDTSPPTVQAGGGDDDAAPTGGGSSALLIVTVVVLAALVTVLLLAVGLAVRRITTLRAHALTGRVSAVELQTEVPVVERAL